MMVALATTLFFPSTTLRRWLDTLSRPLATLCRLADTLRRRPETLRRWTDTPGPTAATRRRPPETRRGPGRTLGRAGPGAPGPNLTMQGDWLDYQTYVPGDVVAYNKQIYVTMSGSAGTPPDQGGNWKLLSITGAPGAPGEVSTYQLNETVRTQASRNTDQLQYLDAGSFSDPAAIAAKVNELIALLKNPV